MSRKLAEDGSALELPTVTRNLQLCGRAANSFDGAKGIAWNRRQKLWRA
jgi:hypothetical protein